MKSYLLFEDGTYYMTQGTAASKNFFGMLVKNESQIGLKCKSTGAFLKAELSSSELECLEKKLEKGNKFLGKFVADELPMDYHVYDLKTAF